MKKSDLIMSVALILLFGTIIWRETDKINNQSSVIMIDNSPKTTTIQTEETSVVTTKKTSEKTSEKTSKKTTKTTKLAKSTKETVQTTEISETYTTPVKLYININTASADELIQLNGIGEYLAEQIILYREANGGFKNVEELINVSGIGEKVLASISEFVYVENPVYETETPDVVVEEFIEEITEEVTTDNLLTLENCIPINLNEADIEILILLPCVDEEIAQRIIDLRNEIGGFTNCYELLFVDGITEERLSEIVVYVCI